MHGEIKYALRQKVLATNSLIFDLLLKTANEKKIEAGHFAYLTCKPERTTKTDGR